jgi:nitrate/TMAO reductase-like tetraheme cytochrome c subunit
MSIPYRPLALAVLALGFFILVLGRAQAGGGHYYTPVADAVVKEECGSCHMAYSPAMLPASSWKRMMGGLQNHFGEDASVDAAKAASIEAYLVANAADAGGRQSGGKLLRGVSLASAPQRITELPKWMSEHREVAASEWTSKDVRSKSNCMACHRDAERGFYED